MAQHTCTVAGWIQYPENCSSGLLNIVADLLDAVRELRVRPA